MPVIHILQTMVNVKHVRPGPTNRMCQILGVKLVRVGLFKMLMRLCYVTRAQSTRTHLLEVPVLWRVYVTLDTILWLMRAYHVLMDISKIQMATRLAHRVPKGPFLRIL